MITNPTPKQIQNCASMGWTYLGDGLFERSGVLGYFTETGFTKE